MHWTSISKSTWLLCSIEARRLPIMVDVFSIAPSLLGARCVIGSYIVESSWFDNGFGTAELSFIYEWMFFLLGDFRGVEVFNFTLASIAFNCYSDDSLCS